MGGVVDVEVAKEMLREATAPLYSRIADLEAELAQVKAELAESRRFNRPPAPGEPKLMHLVAPKPERLF